MKWSLSMRSLNDEIKSVSVSLLLLFSKRATRSGVAMARIRWLR